MSRHAARKLTSVSDEPAPTQPSDDLTRQRRSMIMAMPWPPPTHIVSRPIVLSSLWRLLIRRGHDAGAGHAERMTERDRAAVDVDLVELMPRCLADGITWAANASLISTRSMSSMRHAGAGHRLTAGLDRAETHDLGVEPGHARRHDPGERREAELLGPGVAHHHHGRRAVVEGAGVAGGDLAVGAEHRLEPGELLGGGAVAWAVVGRHDACRRAG